jgi:hypothetical protein
MNLRLLKHSFWYLAVLARCAFDQVYYVVNATAFQSELLLVISTVHYRGCQVVCSLSFDDKVEDIVNIRWQVVRCVLLPRLCFAYDFGCGLSVTVVHAKDPKEVTEWQRLELSCQAILVEPIEEVVAVTLITFLSIVDKEDDFGESSGKLVGEFA